VLLLPVPPRNEWTETILAIFTTQQARSEQPCGQPAAECVREAIVCRVMHRVQWT
jgi:hypothetical protein